MGKIKGKRGVLGIMFVFFVTALLIITITSVFAPIGVQFNAHAYAMGEQIMINSNQTIASINDSEVRTSIQDLIQGGLDQTQSNIEINAQIFKYGWIPVLILVTLVMFMFTRKIVEYGGGGIV